MKKKSKTTFRAPLKIHFAGPAVQNHRIALLDLVSFCRQLQAAVDRAARVLLGSSSSIQSGRKPAEIRNACALDIVAVEGGSLTLTCDLPVKQQVEIFDDLGEEALVSVVNGISVLASPLESLPKGYDKGVLLALREAGRLFSHGISAINLDLQASKGAWHANYTPEIYQQITVRLHKPGANLRTLDGRLLMGDFKESGLRCRLHPALGQPISCSFDETQKEAVLSALTRYVRLTGHAKEDEGKILAFKIEDIEIIDQEEEFEEKG